MVGIVWYSMCSSPGTVEMMEGASESAGLGSSHYHTKTHDTKTEYITAHYAHIFHSQLDKSRAVANYLII